MMRKDILDFKLLIYYYYNNATRFILYLDTGEVYNIETHNISAKFYNSYAEFDGVKIQYNSILDIDDMTNEELLDYYNRCIRYVY